MTDQLDERTVFVVHGRDRAARDALFTFLRSLGLKPLEWQEAVDLTGDGTPYIGDILEAAFQAARAVLVLLTPDDLAVLRTDLQVPNDPSYETSLTGQARPNVLFEAGMAFGRNQSHTILVELGRVRPFSDIGGRHVVYFDGSIAKRQELASRLSRTGCQVDMKGTDWHTAGDFLVESTFHAERAGTSRDAIGIATTSAVVVPGSAPTEVSINLNLDAVKTGFGRYRVTLANDGSQAIHVTAVEVSPETPFYLFESQIDVSLIAGATTSFTVAALYDDPTSFNVPLTVHIALDDGSDVTTNLPFELGPDRTGTGTLAL